MYNDVVSFDRVGKVRLVLRDGKLLLDEWDIFRDTLPHPLNIKVPFFDVAGICQHIRKENFFEN